MTKLIVAFRNFANAPKTVENICMQVGGNMSLLHVISPDFLVMIVTNLIKFELPQWHWWRVAFNHRIQTAIKNFIFCWSCIPV